MTKTKTAAKKKAAPKTNEPERVKVRVLVSGEYDTGTTSWTLAKGSKVLLPKASAERHAEAGKVVIL
jgi:hypothetical protein